MVPARIREIDFYACSGDKKTEHALCQKLYTWKSYLTQFIGKRRRKASECQMVYNRQLTFITPVYCFNYTVQIFFIEQNLSRGGEKVCF